MSRPVPLILCLLFLVGMLFGIHSPFVQGQGNSAGPEAGRSRTVITWLPFTIDSPGSYVLASNLIAASGEDGILIDSDDVSLDLNGFVLQGSPDSGTGIQVRGRHANIAIRNGTIRDWGRGGVNSVRAHGGQYSHLRILQNGARRAGGAGLSCGPNSLVTQCTVLGNGGDGVVTGIGSSVRECVASRNTGNGIFADDGSTVADCNTSFNAGVGVDGGDRVAIRDCQTWRNRGDGIRVGRKSLVIGNHSTNNGGGDDGGAQGAGIRFTGNPSLIQKNFVSGNDVPMESE